jgi:hypothetical protein
MSGLVQSVQWAWGIRVAIEVIVLGLLLLRGHFRKIPVFTAWVAANVCQAGFLYVVYARFGFSSRTALVLAWLSEACTLILRIFATMEVLRLVLRPYRGIWGLGWRVLAVAFGVVVTYSAIEAGRNASWAIVLADRGFHLAFAVALVACLLLIRYYSIPVESRYKVLLGGFCAYSCTVALANTVGHALSLLGFAADELVWQLTTIITYAGVQLAWVAGLWKAAPVEESQPALLTTSFYRQISPQINERLYLLNEQLRQFWGPGATRP